MKPILILGAIIIVVLASLLYFFPSKDGKTVTEQQTTDKAEQVDTTPKVETDTPTDSSASPQTEDTTLVADTTPEGRMAQPETPAVPLSKLKVANFSGKLEKVDVGCFADGECFVEVDGKHITAIMGWSQAVVGTVQGVEGFGDLESHIGAEVEVYAQDTGDGKYTLYGNEGFYIKLK
jgi:hypothetical protein